MNQKYHKWSFLLLGLLIGAMVSLGSFYCLTKKQATIVLRDEMEIFIKLKTSFEEVKDLDNETDTRIYSPSFPHYKPEFIAFEESLPKGIDGISQRIKKQKGYEGSSPEYKEYRAATAEHVDNVHKWELSIKAGKVHSDVLLALVKTHDAKGKSVFEEYAKAAIYFWELEDKYYWSEWCYRNLQLSAIDGCLQSNEWGPYAKKGDENIEERRNAALLTLNLLQGRTESMIATSKVK